MELTDLARLSGQELWRWIHQSLSSTPDMLALGLKSITVLAFSMGARGLNSCPRVCMANTLPTEPSSLPIFNFMVGNVSVTNE